MWSRETRSRHVVRAALSLCLLEICAALNALTPALNAIYEGQHGSQSRAAFFRGRGLLGGWPWRLCQASVREYG